jgi:hypothetical protein
VKRATAAAFGLAWAAVAAGECDVTYPAGGVQGNAGLQAVLPPGSKFVFSPGGPGFVDRDGALGIKFAWDRRIPGDLLVTGRRLDGDAQPARAYLNNGYGDRGFQPVYLVFPTAGCWQVTGGVGEARLTFVVLVEKVGDGPSWHFLGLERGWRVAASPDA